MVVGLSSGSCAAAAAKAATWMLLFGKKKSFIEVETPRGLMHSTQIHDVYMSKEMVSCALLKDGGVEPDLFDALIYAKATIGSYNKDKSSVNITPGIGIGTYDRPGHELNVGEVAFFPAVKTMIEKEVLEVCALADVLCTVNIEIYVPKGEEIAALKYNSKVGISGGIKIYSEKKAIEPFTYQSVVDSIYVELNQRRELGFRYVAITNDEIGRRYFDETYRYEILDKCVRARDFIGDTLDQAKKFGFKAVILTGSFDKMIKLAGGIMNTHSRESDGRLDILASCAVKKGADMDVVLGILKAKDLKEAVLVLKGSGLFTAVMNEVCARIIMYVKKRMGRVEVSCIMFDADENFLAKSEGADRWLILLSQEQGRLA